MTKSVQKVLIFALLVLYLSWETSAAAIIDVESPLKCGNLECPNGSVACETRHEPNDDNKTVTITSQCRDSENIVVAEDITVEDILEGEIPVKSIQRKMFKASDNAQFYSSSFVGTAGRRFVGGKDEPLQTIDIGDEIDIGSYMDEIFEPQIELAGDMIRKTGSWFDEIFGKCFW